MADSRKMEYDNLQAVIASIENAMPNASQSSRPILQTALANARKQLDNLEKEIKKEEQQERAVQEAQIIAAAERETALSRSEKETYSGFLKEDFFTKKDFGRLEGFYAHTWDRLSEHGKDEMSHRVWEGVRHGEYKFSELPKDVREKESERLYLQLTGKERPDPGLKNIPAQDRTDLVREYESGNQKAVAEVLSRKSFSENIYSQKAASRSDAAAAKAVKNDNIQQNLSNEKQAVDSKSVNGDFGGTLADNQAAVSPTALSVANKAAALTR